MQILFTPDASRQWTKLSSDVRSRIGAKLEVLAKTGAGDIKRLKGRSEARLRVGDGRVIFETKGDAIVIAAVGHRRDIYE